MIRTLPAQESPRTDGCDEEGLRASEKSGHYISIKHHEPWPNRS
jgi:hypothetical protein